MSEAFNDYYFTSNITSYTCPDFGDFKCKPPKACARDPDTGRRYCCDYTEVCWTITKTCASDGSTIDCGSGTTSWCCVDGTEVCTKTKNQINICWSSHHDTLTNISRTVLNQTYSSLSSANPKATTWAFAPASLIAATASTASARATSTGSSSSGDTVSVPTGTRSDAGNGFSGGETAGIVVGTVAGFALIVAGLFFLWRRRRRARNTTAGSTAAANDPSAAGFLAGDGSGGGGLDDKPRYGGEAGGYAPSTTTTTTPSYLLSSATPPSELHSSDFMAHELPAEPASSGLRSELSALSPTVGSTQQQPQQQQQQHELPGHESSAPPGQQGPHRPPTVPE